MLAGCGAEAPAAENLDTGTPGGEPSSTPPADDASAQDASAGSSEAVGEAEINYDGTTYTAQLRHCSLSGGEDALFHGSAYDDSGVEVGYLEGDFGNLTDVPYGEARLDFGASGNLQSTDEFIAMGDAAAHIVVTAASDTDLIIMGGLWDQNGTQLATATLKVAC